MDVLKQIALGVVGSLLALGLVGIWGWASAGGIISMLGGVTAGQFEEHVTGLRQGDDECSWVDIGGNKSHYPEQGEWCPAGSFISRIDLDGCESGGNCPIIGRVRCCEIAPDP